MGIEYKLIFIDEYDWGYADKKSKGFVFDTAYYQMDRGDLKQWKSSKRLPE